jgi:hypothetical protein
MRSLFYSFTIGIKTAQANHSEGTITSFQITSLATGQIAKVEFKSNPDFSNVAFDNYNGGSGTKALIIFNVPSAIGSMLAVSRQFGGSQPLLVDVDHNPQLVGGNYYEANYAGRIEVQ